jgi:RES domain
MRIPPVVELTQRDTVRLVSSGRFKESALRPLAANINALDSLTALEGLTNARLQGQETGLPHLDPRELVFGRPGYTLINAAFTHTRPGGNRFNPETRGAWYCGFTVQTALGEIAYHLTRELEHIGRFNNVTDYGELLADFFGAFHDLCGEFAHDAALDADPARGYPIGQALARELRVNSHSNGMVYPSVRQRGGFCLVAFRPDLVQNLRRGSLWRLCWQGTPNPSVTRV